MPLFVFTWVAHNCLLNWQLWEPESDDKERHTEFGLQARQLSNESIPTETADWQLRRGLALNEVVDPQQDQRSDQGHDETRRLAFLIPANQPADPSAQESDRQCRLA